MSPKCLASRNADCSDRIACDLQPRALHHDILLPIADMCVVSHQVQRSFPFLNGMQPFARGEAAATLLLKNCRDCSRGIANRDRRGAKRRCGVSRAKTDASSLVGQVKTGPQGFPVLTPPLLHQNTHLPREAPPTPAGIHSMTEMREGPLHLSPPLWASPTNNLSPRETSKKGCAEALFQNDEATWNGDIAEHSKRGPHLALSFAHEIMIPLWLSLSAESALL